MARPRRILPLDAEATTTRTETEAPALALVSPVAAVEAPQRTQPRQRLAEAIAAVAAIEADIAETGAAVTKAGDDYHEAAMARQSAERALERAKPQPLAGTFTPRAPTVWGTREEYDLAVLEQAAPPLSLADARAALAVATDARDSAVRAEQFHKSRLENLEQTLRFKRSSVKDAVRVVIRADPALVALAAEARRLATRAAAAAMAFETATGGDVIQPGSPFYRCTDPADARTSPEARADWAVSRAWSEALDRLHSDPDALLPV